MSPNGYYKVKEGGDWELQNVKQNIQNANPVSSSNTYSKKEKKKPKKRRNKK